jgi:hypothetical protein
MRLTWTNMGENAVDNQFIVLNLKPATPGAEMKLKVYANLTCIVIW